MLGVAATLIGDKIRTDVQRELGGIGRATGEYSVDIDLITLAGSFHCALAVGIIPIVGHETVVVHLKQTVLLVPDELALTDTVVPMSVGHHTARVDNHSEAISQILFKL